MRPLRVEMEGFGAFRERTVVDFADIDLVALTGDTGAGKSTIVDAITFALYGSVVRYDDDRLVNAAINQTSTQARLQLDFELGGRRYTAVRVVRRTRTGATTREARLLREDEVLAADAPAMGKAVEQLLGLDLDQFNRTVVLPQGRFADFLHAKPSERQATLRQLLGLEMYSRIAARARSRAGELRNQVTGLRIDVDERAAALTETKLGELRALVVALNEARVGFDGLRDELLELEATERDIVAERALNAAQVEQLSAVVVPADLDGIDAAVSAARRNRDDAVAVLNEAQEARRGAIEAAERGPDAGTARVHLAWHDELAALETERERSATALADAQAAVSAAEVGERAALDEQVRLEAALSVARSAADEARRALTARPSDNEIDAWLAAHTRLELATREVAAAEQAVADAAAALEPLGTLLAHAEADAAVAAERLAAAERQVGVAAYASMLAIGEPCPLCLQEVHELVAHDVADVLVTAKHDAEVATRTAEGARRDATSAQQVLERARAALEVRQEAHLHAVEETSSIRTPDELRDLKAVVAALIETADSAERKRAAAEQALAVHRDSQEARTALSNADTARRELASCTGVLTALVGQIDARKASLVDVPNRGRLESLLAEADRLHAARREAEERETLADGAARQAIADALAVESRLETGRQAIRSVHARLQTLGAPDIESESLERAWSTLTGWTHEILTGLRERQAQLDALSASIAAEALRVRGAMSSLLRPFLDVSLESIDVATTDRELTRLHTQAESAVDDFLARRRELEQRLDRIRTMEEQASVAERLGQLLRADGFEGWLMEEAITSLVERATVRLLELSGGQYSLVVENRTILVRDHTNADELRNVRTLSGGETFLASLALALALAEATAELAPEGSPDLESIFLDEGFGTLDAHTLDAVASAIEELGATGRLVGIITHIRELAERMPVRLEVTKTAGSSRVQRVEV